MAYSELANWIKERNVAITCAWAETVRQEPRIQSDAELSDDGLRDHIPAVIDEICELLRAGQQPTIINTREARVHAYVRFRQGYRARELVRELSLLRITLLDHLGELLISGAMAVTVENYLAVARLLSFVEENPRMFTLGIRSLMSYLEQRLAQSPGQG